MNHFDNTFRLLPDLVGLLPESFRLQGITFLIGVPVSLLTLFLRAKGYVNVRQVYVICCVLNVLGTLVLFPGISRCLAKRVMLAPKRASGESSITVDYLTILAADYWNINTSAELYRKLTEVLEKRGRRIRRKQHDATILFEVEDPAHTS
jgi:hypothetical protein